MKWKNDYLTALDEAKLFQDTGHRTRFKELMDCYAGFPFFSRGLCKCIYLSAWEDEHFAIMLETLNEMTLGREKNTGEMLDKGDSLAAEQTGGEHQIYRLSLAFLEERPFRLEEGVVLEPEYRYILDQALKASDVIDQLPEPSRPERS